MKYFLALLLLCTAAAATARAQDNQGKGVDNQTGRIRDTGSDRQPGNNGRNQSVGTGRGLDFGGGRTPIAPPLPNPYRFGARRDAVLNAAQELLRERKLVVDTGVSKPEDGILVTQPYRFVKGTVVAVTELNRYSELPTDTARGWSQGRYTLLIEVQPIDGVTTNVSVNARIEGRSDGAAGAEWISLRSNGTAEQEFLCGLIGKLTGATPAGCTAQTSAEP
ncbi:MAG TPA: hypothetical protein VF546_13395 [Pyrinomonadaceae bacterium]|jgi:hypothetical protein